MMARVKLESHVSHAVRARWAVPVGASGRDALVRHLVYAFIRSDPEGATDWIDSTVPTDPDELRTMLDFLLTARPPAPLPEDIAADLDTLLEAEAAERGMVDPQVLLVTGKGMSNMTAKSVLDNTVEGVDFSTLSSVRSGRVYSTGLGMWNWFTPNPDSPVVANWLGKSLYPDQFADIDLPALTKDYYHRMYAFDLTDEQVATIIDPDA